MKKRLLAIVTLSIFLIGMFGSSAVAMATTVQPNGKTATVTNTPIKNGKGEVVSIPGMMDLSIKPAGAATSHPAYCFNASKTMPSAAGTTGYVLAADQSNDGFAKHAEKPLMVATLSDNVRNVIWNGYPYFGGTWKGVVGDPANHKTTHGMTDQARLTALYNMQVTQQVVWHYTDSKMVDAKSVLAKDVAALEAAAKLNPAPANFKLDLYDGSAAKTQHVLALMSDANAAKKLVNVKVESKWVREDDKSEYTGPRPSVSYELYEGDIEAGEQPLKTYWLPAGVSSLNIPLIDDQKKYTIREVLTNGGENFKVENNQAISLDKVNDAMVPVTFNNVFTGDAHHNDPEAMVPAVLPVGAEVTLDGKNPPDGSCSFLLKDNAGNIVQTRSNKGKVVTFDPLKFDKEGIYVYTLTELVGDNKNINYDGASYELTVTVSKDQVLKADLSLKKNGAVYSGLVPVFANTTKDGAQTTTLTVHKVWKNDKVASRPAYVNVQLYRNGSAYGDLVRLDSSNGWQYTWKDLDTAYKWTVNEPTVPSGYTKTLQTKDKTWTITNTGKSTPVITTPTTNKNNTTNGNKGGVVTTLPVTNNGTPETGDSSHLNWWMTGATISLSGMCLIALLWILNRRKQQSKK